MYLVTENSLSRRSASCHMVAENWNSKFPIFETKETIDLGTCQDVHF